MAYNKNNTALIITMYIGNDKKRQKLYEKNILDWLKYTPFKIYTVESSGRKLNIKHERLHEFTYKQKHGHKPRASLTEKYSILLLLKEYPEIENYKLVFKITGKYFCPNFMNEYKNIPNGSNIILQNAITNLDFENTECIGMNGNRIKDILSFIKEGNWFYELFYKIVKMNFLLFLFILYTISFIIFKYASKNIGIITAIISTVILLITFFIRKKVKENGYKKTLKKFKQYIKIIIEEISYEEALKIYIMTNSDLKIHRFNPLQIKRKFPRGNGSILPYL
jgi:hypothetical protein